MTLRILVAEDEEISRKHMVRALRKEGHEVVPARDGAEAARQVAGGAYDVVIADMNMPGATGMELLEKVKSSNPETEVVIITGFGSIGSVVEAMKKGAYDYLPKPFETDDLVLRIRKLEERRDLKRENIALRKVLGREGDLMIVAESPGMKKVMKLVAGIRGSDCPVLLTGESGVGKNLLAKTIHSLGTRARLPLLAVNCATFTEELLASELFGHERGAFTGAVALKRGLVEIAAGGTLFLDEIADMPPPLQAKLLKVIEDGEFFRVGGTKSLKVDVRFMGATNQMIHQLIERGEFRRDLYYRLNVMEIPIPPLRDRREDIAPLAALFLKRHAPKYGKKIVRVGSEALAVLKGYTFPGNVRELENIIERAVILEEGDEIGPSSLPKTINAFQIETLDPSHIRTLEEVELQYARSVLEAVGGNKAEAARLLGVSRTSLWRMLKEE